MPIISEREGAALKTEARDPGVMMDDDGGVPCFQLLVRLGADTRSLAERPRAVIVNNATSLNGVGILDDNPFLYQREGRYFLSFGCFYGVLSSVYGPFDYIGTWVD